MKAALLVALLAASGATAQLQNPNEPTETTLYFHVFDLFNNFVINTQPMNVEFFVVGGTNFPSIPPTPEIAENGWDFNTIYGISTAGPVEYDVNEDGRPRFHPERGIAADVELTEGYTPVTKMYFKVPDVTGETIAPGPLPYFTVEVTMRTGDEPGSDAKLDEGEIIMQGRQTYHIISGNAAKDFTDPAAEALPLDYPVLISDEDSVVEVEIPMTVIGDKIPKEDAFNIRVDWYQFADSAAPVQDDQVSQGNIKIHADQERSPRMSISVDNPVNFEFIHPQVAGGVLLIHSGANSPWGTYDLDVKNVTVDITGPSEPKSLRKVIAQNAVVHGLHDQAAEITYLWEFRDEKAANGDYSIDMTISNYFGTATASGKAGFTIEGTKAYGISDEGEVVAGAEVEEQESPVPLFLAAVALVGVALLRRK